MLLHDPGDDVKKQAAILVVHERCQAAIRRVLQANQSYTAHTETHTHTHTRCKCRGISGNSHSRKEKKQWWRLRQQKDTQRPQAKQAPPTTLICYIQTTLVFQETLRVPRKLAWTLQPVNPSAYAGRVSRCLEPPPPPNVPNEQLFWGIYL